MAAAFFLSRISLAFFFGVHIPRNFLWLFKCPTCLAFFGMHLPRALLLARFLVWILHVFLAWVFLFLRRCCGIVFYCHGVSKMFWWVFKHTAHLWHFLVCIYDTLLSVFSIQHGFGFFFCILLPCAFLCFFHISC